MLTYIQVRDQFDMRAHQAGIWIKQLGFAMVLEANPSDDLADHTVQHPAGDAVLVVNLDVSA